MRILRAGERRASPWKNGGGTTHEVLVFPPGARFDTFDWRISIASVEADGPFSHLPGIHRRLAILAGRLALTIADRSPLQIGTDSPAIELDGEVAVHAKLLGGPVTDLNVMTRRGRCHSSMARKAVASSETLTTHDTTILVALAALGLEHRGESFRLEPYDAVVFDAPASATLTPQAGACTCYLIAISALQEKK